MHDVLTVVLSASMELPTCDNCYFFISGTKLDKYTRSKQFKIICVGLGGEAQCDVIKRGWRGYCDVNHLHIHNSLNLCDVIFCKLQ